MLKRETADSTVLTWLESAFSRLFHQVKFLQVTESGTQVRVADPKDRRETGASS